MSDQTYKTRDFYEASYIYACRQVLVDLEWSGNQCFFVFSDSQTCEQLRQAYWNRTADINAFEFAQAIRTLKDRLYARR